MYNSYCFTVGCISLGISLLCLTLFILVVSVTHMCSILASFHSIGFP